MIKDVEVDLHWDEVILQKRRQKPTGREKHWSGTNWSEMKKDLIITNASLIEVKQSKECSRKRIFQNFEHHFSNAKFSFLCTIFHRHCDAVISQCYKERPANIRRMQLYNFFEGKLRTIIYSLLILLNSSIELRAFYFVSIRKKFPTNK